MTFELVRGWLGGGLALAGGIFMIIGAVGLLRMPDVFTRMHATSVSDILGGGLILVGLMIIAGLSLVTVKLIFLVLFLGMIGPVSTHAVARAALHAGVKPMVVEGVESIPEEESPSKP